MPLLAAGRDKRLPAPGNCIQRVYKDRIIQVIVLADGFEFDGKKYKSLSAITELNERTAHSELELHQLNIQISQLETSELADAEIRAAFSDFDTLWKSVSQREQGKLMEVLVERVEYDPHDVAISVSFHRSGIKTLAAKADEVLV